MHSTLHWKCHHETIYSKHNLEIEYPPPYTCKIWYYNRSETDLSNSSIKSFNWSQLFSEKNVHDQVDLFNKLILNVFHNFIPNKIIVCDERDPPWINDVIKKGLTETIGYFKVKESLVTLTLQFLIRLRKIYQTLLHLLN